MKTGAIKLAKRVAAAAVMAVAVTVSTGWAGLITVCKTDGKNGEDECNAKSIQEAVNKAAPGDVIEIRDTEVYNEQVTIDGRGDPTKPSIWDGKNQGGGTSKVNGGKNGITIKYAPTGARLFGNHARPVIRWKDVTNQSPKTYEESLNESELPGGSGNFSTCGALRIMNAQGVIIDGIEIRGGGAAPFAWEGVWGRKDPVVGGNAAVVVHGSGGAIIRNCVIDSGFFGIAVKDRNTGGVFGNPNPNDNDKTIPLSGFGQAGNHLFEYNKIKSNILGVFFESSWDLGSSIRHNLIYNNIYSSTVVSTLKANNDVTKSAGAIFFRDVKLSPVAIYNNTFYNNSGNILGGWKKGKPHLAFNNIFGKPGFALGAQPNEIANNSLEKDLPYRMHNCVFSATAEMKRETRYVNGCRQESADIHGQNIYGITQVRVANGFPSPLTGPTTVTCNPPLASMTATTNEFMPNGALIATAQNQPPQQNQGSFEASANIRWLETTKSVEGTEDLFESTSESSADFLRPKWTHPLVVKYIKGQGWSDIGMRNSDGTPADIGAVPYTGRAPTTTVRVKPSNVVLISGTKADAKFFVSVENGSLINAKISFLRWIAPLPFGEKDGDAPYVPSGSITKLTPPTTTVLAGGNSASFNLQKTMSDEYGFFEVVITGKDASGNDVTSDIGFLPYRKLEYSLKIEFFEAGSTTATKTIKVGEQYRMHVTPCKGSDPTTCGTYGEGAINEISFDLQSSASAFMYKWGTETALLQDGPTPSANISGGTGKDYNIYFTKAGAETVMGSGRANLSGDKSLVFLGTADITIKPGAPDHISFVSPIPKSRLAGAPAPTIFKGVSYEVQVMVQDKYDNPVDVAVPVTIKSEDPNIGNVAPASANTATSGAKTGIATFTANVTNGKTKDEFDLTANFSFNGKSGSDVGRLRVGKSPDRFEVFFSDTGAGGNDITVYQDLSVTIDGNRGDWFKITVKVVVGDMVVTSRPAQWINVESVSQGDKMIFSATQGGAEATVFELRSGVATFWVSTAPDIAKDIEDGGVYIYALNTKDPKDVDGSVARGFRDGINFKTPVTKIDYAVVYGDGHGRPDSVIVKYKRADGSAAGPLSAAAKPNKVSLDWGKKTLEATNAMITVVDDVTLRANLTSLTDRPTGYTSISGGDFGRGRVKVTGGDAVEDNFDVYDGVGPIFADTLDGSGPRIVQNTGAPNDTINVTLSEKLRDYTKLTKILYKAPANPPAPGEPSGITDGDPLDVLKIIVQDSLSYRLVVGQTANNGHAEAGGWIRLTEGVADNAATQSAGVLKDNPPHARNRWVQLKLWVVPPGVNDAWYTGGNAVGKPNFAYVVLNKGVQPSDFTGGSVTAGGKTVTLPNNVNDIEEYVKVKGTKKDTLEINLVKAAPSVAVSGPIKTGGVLQFTLGYNKETTWPNKDVIARDRAAPVIAKPVVLKTGAVKDEKSSTFYNDTLIVTYSEKLNSASLALSLTDPVTIKHNDGIKDYKYNPELKVLTSLDEGGGYYKVSYEITKELDYPLVAGDSIQVNFKANIRDNVDELNVQTDPDNKWQPLDVDATKTWTIKVKSNPFVSGGVSGPEYMEVEMSPNIKSSDNMEIAAYIRIFDNLGTLVLYEEVVTKDEKIYWKWYGQNSKGRLVGTGTYLFKASCEYKKGGKVEEKHSFAKYLGIVRGRK